LAHFVVELECVLLKTFIFGIVLGIAAAAAALYLYRVDLVRETSVATVAPNGGSIETLHIDLPADRIMLGAAAQSIAVPASLQWPDDEVLANIEAEIFKVRDSRNTVIGVASRTQAKEDEFTSVDWVVHLPARGSIFATLDSTEVETGVRNGLFAAGSREFDSLRGRFSERITTGVSGEDGSPTGRIELTAIYVGELAPLEETTE